MTDTIAKKYERLPEEIQSKRQPCQIMTRVMGYYSTLRSTLKNPDGTFSSLMNIGKRSEAYSREYFDYDKTNESLDMAAANKDFNDKF